jgi:hypothetical protein
MHMTNAASSSSTSNSATNTATHPTNSPTLIRSATAVSLNNPSATLQNQARTTMLAAAQGASITLNPTQGYIGSTFQWTLSGFPPTVPQINPNTGKPFPNEAAVMGVFGEDDITLDASGGATGSFAVRAAYGWPSSNDLIPDTYKVIAEDLYGNTANALFTVLPTYQNISIRYGFSQGPIGSIVQFDLSGFFANESITVNFGGSPVANITTDLSGGTSFSFFTVPSVEPGTHEVTAIDADGYTASTPFTVTSPSISLSPKSGPVGTRVSFTGTGFMPGAGGLVNINWSATVVAICAANSSGAISGSFNVPWDASPGGFLVVAADAAFSLCSELFTVTGSPSPSPSSSPSLSPSPSPSPSPTPSTPPPTTNPTITLNPRTLDFGSGAFILIVVAVAVVTVSAVALVARKLTRTRSISKSTNQVEKQSTGYG